MEDGLGPSVAEVAVSWGDVDRQATLGFTEEAVGGTVMGSGGSLGPQIRDSQASDDQPVSGVGRST